MGVVDSMVGVVSEVVYWKKKFPIIFPARGIVAHHRGGQDVE
jgi:hypothetical protein